MDWFQSDEEKAFRRKADELTRYLNDMMMQYDVAGDPDLLAGFSDIGTLLGGLKRAATTPDVSDMSWEETHALAAAHHSNRVSNAERITRAMLAAFYGEDPASVPPICEMPVFVVEGVARIAAIFSGQDWEYGKLAEEVAGTILAKASSVAGVVQKDHWPHRMFMQPEDLEEIYPVPSDEEE